MIVPTEPLQPPPYSKISGPPTVNTDDFWYQEKPYFSNAITGFVFYVVGAPKHGRVAYSGFHSLPTRQAAAQKKDRAEQQNRHTN